MNKALMAMVCVCVLGSGRLHGEEFKLYFGLMHGHTSFSDGSGTPDEAFEMAKDAGLDFMAITEHNHRQAAGDDGVFLTPQNYGELISAARQATEADKFLAIWGQEISTISAGNHACIYFSDEICDMPNGDFKDLYERFLPRHPEIPFIQFNHPGAAKDRNRNTPKKERNNDYGIDDYDGDFEQLVAAAGKHTALIELVIGPAFSEHTDMIHQQGKHEADYLFYLDKGFRLGPSVGQDNHKKTWGTATHARMGVWAKSLGAEEFIDAIRERRCFASEDDNAEVWMTANGRAMDSILTQPANNVVRLKIDVKDDDEPDATYRVRLFYDDAPGDDQVAKVIESQNLPEGGGELEFTRTAEPGGYFFFKVTQNSDHDDDIWTAPVWLAAANAPVQLAASANLDDPQKREIRWDEASDYVGEDVTVTGKLVRSFKFQDKAVFFNFDPDYENTLSLVILKSDFDAFGGEDAVVELQRKLTNKSVRAKGKITLYRDERIQIRLEDPSQLVAQDSTDEETEE
jgi:hypothetical protein